MKINFKELFKSKKFKIGAGILAGIIVMIILLVIIRSVVASKKNADTTYTVKSEVYSNEISVSGVVSAAQEQTLQALSDGTVVKVYVKQGDKVKKGDVIIQMDDTTEQYNLAKHDYEMETTRISGSKKELQLMETERLSLVQKIAERKVTATFDGIIADIDVNVGDSLEAKDSVGTLVNTDYLLADVEVAETDVSKLKVGQKVECTFPAYDGTLEGYVVSWPAIGSVTSRGATVVEVRIRIDDYPEVVLPNFSFSGVIKISDDVNYLLVERYAVGHENGQAFVVKAKGNEKVEVKVIPYSGDYVRIVEGEVSEGDVLKQQITPKRSGSKRNQGKGGPEGPGEMGGGPGGGAGGPPPGM